MPRSPRDPPERSRSRSRRPPPPFRAATVLRTTEIGPRLRRVTLAGTELTGFPVPLPAASVRLLLPTTGTADLVIPTWNGNEFLLPDGTRPALRTFTPRRVDPSAGEVDIDVVLHGRGVASEWAATVAPGVPAALSGPGRGYTIDPDAPAFLLVGDETALPAIAQLLEALPGRVATRVLVEVAAPDGRITLPHHANTTVEWHDLVTPADPGAAMVAAVRAETFDPQTRVWVAGEAAAVQRIRTHLFAQRAVPRAHATVRGYWKRARGGVATE